MIDRRERRSPVEAGNGAGEQGGEVLDDRRLRCFFGREPAELALLAGDRRPVADGSGEDTETNPWGVPQVDDHLTGEPQLDQVQPGFLAELAPGGLSGRLAPFDMTSDTVPQAGPRASTGRNPLQQDVSIVKSEDQRSWDDLVALGVEALAVQRHPFSVPFRTEAGKRGWPRFKPRCFRLRPRASGLGRNGTLVCQV